MNSIRYSFNDHGRRMIPFLKLLFTLSLLPFMVSFFHLDHWLQSSELCFVGPSMSSKPISTDRILADSELYGIYRPNLSRDFYSKTDTRSTAVSLDQTQKQQYGPLQIVADAIMKPQGYPSILMLTDDLMNADKNYANSNAKLSFNLEEQVWCFEKRDQIVCIGTSTHDMFPPMGSTIQLRSISATASSCESTQSVSISCPGKTSYRLFQWPIKMIQSNPNLEFLQRPATSFLILVNVALAFIYWNNRVDPSSVCKEYQKIVHDNELWRSLSGATAHFEPLHIGFNMMSLYALGSELEPMYESIPFLFHNMCLIPLTTIVMMTLVWLQMRWTGDERLKQTKTVGYSGVLFAWMVVSSLERRSTCPVPFLPDLCFKTKELGTASKMWNLKFNFGPVVQLCIAQMIMPRVSFIGHLGGIICGFILHWNILPREVFYSPQVVIPFILFAHLWLVRKLFSFRRTYELHSTGAADVDNGSITWDTKESASRNCLLIWFERCMVGVAILSSLMFSVFGSLFLSQAITTALVTMSCHLYRKGSTKESAVLFKASIVSLILLIAVDAIHLPYWISLSVFISARWNIFGSYFLVAFFIIRSLVNFAVLLTFSSILTEIGDINGIFHHMVGWVLRTAHAALEGVQREKFSPFQGQGIALGII